uniref:Organ specific protein n=1 Tax=Steinernema glaseri TaxID=37863 RepID=A0A1I7ZQF5_9BILA
MYLLVVCVSVLFLGTHVHSAPVPQGEFETIRFSGSDDHISQTVPENSSDARKIVLNTPLPPELQEDDKYIEENEDVAKEVPVFMMNEDASSETAPPPLNEAEIPKSIREGTIDAKRFPDFVKPEKEAKTSGGIVKDRKFEDAAVDLIPFDAKDFN